MVSGVFLNLVPGQRYWIVWPGHYNKHLSSVGTLGEFVRMQKKHDSLHGDFLWHEAVFYAIKEQSGRRSHLFTVRTNDNTTIREATAP